MPSPESLRRRMWCVAISFVAVVTGGHAFAQPASPPESAGTTPAGSAYRPAGRASIYSTLSRTSSDDGTSKGESALNTSLFLRPSGADNSRRYDYGIDLRYATFSDGRSTRTSIYEAFAEARNADGTVRVRGGHMWLDDLGALGSVAGAHVEYREPDVPGSAEGVRVGLFGGLEPSILDIGYASDVKKLGGYATWVGSAAQRDTLGYVIVRNAGVTERSALTTTNYVPFGRRFTLFQAAEFDISRPGGQADRGLTYLFASARAVLSERFNLQGSYQRGRSIDARGIAEAVNTGRAVTQQTLTGLLYESAGGRATVNLPKRSVGAGTIFGGYYHDRLDETSGVSHRTVVGGQVIDLAESGLDVMVTDSRVNRTSGTYHSRYVSVGAQVTDRIYVMGDYSSSLAIIRFGRGSGLLIETRPRTVRWSGSVTGSLTRVMGLLVVVERTTDETYRDVRILSGLTYRLR